MAQSNTRTMEVVIPAASVRALRQSLVEQLGADAAATALQYAGHAAGDAFQALLATEDGDPGSMPENEFWRQLFDLLSNRGWGQLIHRDAHPGVGTLQSGNWAESDPDNPADGPSCFFTTGLLARLLEGVAGRQVGVFEVECRSAGDAHCRFLFGGAQALEGVYAALTQGDDVESAIASLG